jgi:hypothetical protein
LKGLKRKELETKALSDKIEDEHEHFNGAQKKIKELQARVSEVEEEVEAERAAKVRLLLLIHSLYLDFLPNVNRLR